MTILSVPAEGGSREEADVEDIHDRLDYEGGGDDGSALADDAEEDVDEGDAGRRLLRLIQERQKRRIGIEQPQATTTEPDASENRYPSAFPDLPYSCDDRSLEKRHDKEINLRSDSQGKVSPRKCKANSPGISEKAVVQDANCTYADSQHRRSPSGNRSSLGYRRSRSRDHRSHSRSEYCHHSRSRDRIARSSRDAPKRVHCSPPRDRRRLRSPDRHSGSRDHPWSSRDDRRSRSRNRSRPRYQRLRSRHSRSLSSDRRHE